MRLINWVTKGIFLGERHGILTPQPDDLFNVNDMWSSSLACGTSPNNTSITYRISGNVLVALARGEVSH